jgi:hypothetical protein
MALEHGPLSIWVTRSERSAPGQHGINHTTRPGAAVRELSAQSPALLHRSLPASAAGLAGDIEVAVEQPHDLLVSQPGA